MNRILVVGSTGSGKTTIGKRLARNLDIPFVELDALYWGPGWTPAPAEVFRPRVEAATAGDRWIVDGNYWVRLGDDLWDRADTVVWLDPPFALVLLRIVGRTIATALLRTDHWGTGNRARISDLWSRNSLLGWAVRTRRPIRDRCTEAIVDPRWSHLCVFRLRSRRSVKRFMRESQRA